MIKRKIFYSVIQANGITGIKKFVCRENKEAAGQ